ncbi:nitrogen fixation protein NifQ [Rhodobium gokarnense]|uniref:Nitrogen fixation protein NifQ n=1 Tax=Rhodobium gokarnense TaxID=364296 RepID=A0ABT3H940_9HYPH|nr:nitrogen fixation protein NifQ [Rhodobium gokarnense]MCW2306922.1 nitrogen fixation protein NifQ [Rhodobium gokarnense]
MTKPLPLAAGETQTLHQALFQRLMASARGGPNDGFIAQMLASWMADRGGLPRWMGLTEAQFGDMLCRHFGRLPAVSGVRDDRDLPDDMDELEDLRALLMEFRAGQDESELWVADLVVAGCTSADHLWSDLGLFSRPQLTAMLTVNFPALAVRNDRNMKWKKFLYKQLCEREGIYVCRAPSCAVCADYAQCFAPEEE